MVLARLRRTGADPPFGDPRRYHGVPMEGWFWRLADAATGTVVVALTSVNRDRAGRTWGMAALALHPGGAVAELAPTEATGEPLRLVRDGAVVLEATEERLRVDLGRGGRLDVRFTDRAGWPRRAFGGGGAGHLVPGLGQYWHPHLLGARVHGEATVGGRHVVLDGASAYAEKNWGAGFPKRGWWWGQAQGFAGREDACVAFAGGHVGPLPAGALVVRLGDELIHVVRPPLVVRPDGWGVRARTPRYAIEVEAQPRDAALRLPVPVPAEGRVVHGPSAQHLAGDLRLTVRRRGRTVFDGRSSLAGLEHGDPA